MNDPEVSQVARALKTLEPGLLPLPLFEQIVRLTTMSIIEIVPLRLRDGEVDILLHARPDDDPVWPGQLHTAGSVIRPTDTRYEDVLQRILQKELGLHTGTPTFVMNLLHHSGRGRENAMVYWLEVTEATGGGTFYNADNLPQNLVQSQLDFIPAAAAHFKQSKQL